MNTRMGIFSILLLSCAIGVSAKIKYSGTNEAVAEFGSAIPGVYMVDYSFPTNAGIDYMLRNGLNTIRVPFLWERLQRPITATSLIPDYLNRLDSVVQYVTVTKGAYLVLDVHNYARYDGKIMSATGACTYTHFKNMWKMLAGAYKNNPKVIFGLMNEPYEMPNENVFAGMQAGIDGIRESGATNLILVPGNSWTGAHSWIDSGSSVAMNAIRDPLNNFMYEMHQYFDQNYSGNGPCVPTFDPVTIFGPATAWLRAKGVSGFLGEFGIENSPACLDVLEKTMKYLKANEDVWEGWTWWAAGPWWGKYKFSLEEGVGNQQLAILAKYAASAATGGATPTPQTTGVQTTAKQTTGVQTTAKQTTGVQTTAKQTTGVQTTAKQTTGVQTTAKQTTGVQTTSKQTTGVQTTAKQTTGVQTTAKQTTGVQTTAKQTTGVQTTGVQTTGVQTTGVQTTGLQQNATTGDSSQCSGSETKCASETFFKKCFNGVFAAPQSCQAGLVCRESQSTQEAYCVRPGEVPRDGIIEENSGNTLHSSLWVSMILLSIYLLL